ncbi:MAG: Type 1 glutamine amidotransferase-like domain-containing protein, partial [Ignavibacteriaceae bacterium]|nr:Type 1 glutamine amidotransferase-like domain-containing protein [Ignavibacteriaceae bacterium]
MLKYFFITLLYLGSLNAQGFICAVGGGSEDYGSWSDDPYGWIVDKGDSGRVVILYYGDATNWLPNYFVSLGASNAYNKKISTREDADLQATYDELITAKIIFLKGGDQWQYVKLWKGTKTEDAIRYVFENGGVVAGTSAGAMILGDVCFSAQYSSPDSRTALLNPASSSLSLDDD